MSTTFPDPSVLWFQGMWVTPSGVIDGVNKVFTLPNIPNPPESLILYLRDPAWALPGTGGLVQFGGVEYDLVDDTITYITAPGAGSTHRAFARFGGLVE